MNRDKSWGRTLDDLKHLAAFRNVLFDVSAVGDLHAVEAAIEILSSERLVWGSDYPWEPPDVSMRRLIDDPKISVMDLFHVFSQTATGLLNRISSCVAKERVK
jgi:predicted TIM-barrel fold metal-dependent hydrolase